jgi:hypothetical protein
MFSITGVWGGARSRTPHHHTVRYGGYAGHISGPSMANTSPGSDEGLAGWYRWAWSPPPGGTRPAERASERASERERERESERERERESLIRNYP